jgi:uncharacterized membrane protein YdjX (TVP38/TMEM64 family)
MKLLAPLLAALAGLGALRLLGPDVVSQAQLRRWLAPLGQLAPLAFIGFLAVRPLTLLPGQVLCALGGLLFGVVWGTVYAMVGSALSFALVHFLSKRLGGKRLMRKVAGHRYEALRGATRRHDFKFMALATLSPIVPTDVVIAAAACSGARFYAAGAGLLVGTLPGTVLTAQFGSALGQGKTILTIVSAGALVVSLVLGVIVGRQIARDVRDGPPGAPA